jgi:hypothetical protein
MRLATIPVGALVEHDGRALDRAPVSLDLAPGTATFRVSLDGYEAETIALDVAPGAIIDRTLTLRPSLPAPTSTKEAPVGTLPAPPRVAPRAAPPQKPHINVRVLDDDDSR